MNKQRIIKFLWLICSFFIRIITRVRKNRIICWSYYGKQFSCNPYYITQYLLENHKEEYDIYWMFQKGVDVSCVPPDIKIVYLQTWKYIWIINTAEFLITNTRTGLFFLHGPSENSKNM